MRKYRYFKSCVDFPTSGGNFDALVKMIDEATDITYRTLMQHVDREEVAQLPYFDFYDWRKRPYDLTLKNDWAVSYHRSKYKGKRVYYIRHSGIEYIFI